MGDLSVKTASEGAVNPPRKAALSEVKTASEAGASASDRQKTVDVSNYVTSPKGVVDPESGVYVLQYRDGDTGEVLNQYPSKKVVAAYKQGASTGETAPAPAETAAPTTTAGSGSGGDVGATVDTSTSTVSTASVGDTSTGQGSTTTSTSTSVDV